MNDRKRIIMNQNDMNNDIDINIPKQPRPKPLRKLTRINSNPSQNNAPVPPQYDIPQQQYHGLHEADPDDNPYERMPQGNYQNWQQDVTNTSGYDDYDDDEDYDEEDTSFSWKDLVIKVLSVAGSLVIIAVLILNMPIIWFHDKRDGTKKNVSLRYYLKNEQFLGYIEGNIDKQKHDPQINTEVVEIDYDDGLDLPQKIEGQFTVLFLGFDEDVCNTDIMWIMEFDIRGGKMNILQIPRDSFMPYYTSSPNGKANSIYNLGRADVQPPIQRVVDAVEESFGIPIDAYITTVCTDIVDIVDLIGGIPMHLEEQIMYEGDKIIPAGDITLSGQQTEWFMRYRYGWLEGDIGRVKNQRRFMAAAMKKLISIVGGGEDNLYKFLYEIYKNKWIATDMSVGDLTKLGDFAGTIELENVFVNMVPGEGSSMDNLYIGPDGNGYSLYSIHKQETIDMLNKYYRPYQRKMLLSDSTIAELYTDHAYGVYDDTGATLDKLERATEPPRDPNK